MDIKTAQISQGQPSGRLYLLLSSPSSRYLLLQSLVSIILSYELIFSGDSSVSLGTSNGVVAGLWVSMVVLARLPESVLTATWFSAGLVAVDTILVTAVIYLSGNARSDLYIAYFVLMLVAASVRRLSHVMGLSLLLSLGYAVVLYEGALQTGMMATGHLLGIPILLVMAVFYGVALETTALVQEEKSTLLKDVESLKQTENELQSQKLTLEERIKILKAELTQANTELVDGQVVRQGLERQLHEAQKLEAVGRVAARIAGEFGSLFSIIGKQTGVMLSQLQPHDPLRSAADELFKVGEKAATLTAQLIALNLDDRPVRTALPIHRVVSDLHSTIVSLMPEGIHLNIQSDQSVAYAEVDRNGLENVVFQLVVNARDAMPNGGRLSLEVKTTREPSLSPGAMSLRARGPHVMIQISDTGTGMNLDTQAHMFEPFFSTKETNIGLGLTAAYGIVKQNGGMLEVESRPGKGTTVRVCFPAVSVPDTQEDLKPSWPRAMKPFCLLKRMKLNGSLRCRPYSAIAIACWKRVPRWKR
jgi:two-component system, cell cycle sensor histidine kinase and response regulator CckA